MQRIDFAIDQINLELQGRLETFWEYHNRDAHDIRYILFTFRRDGCGRFISNHKATQNYRNSLQTELTYLLGVEPRLELKDGRWVIWYS
jgi:hypothetical protein